MHTFHLIDVFSINNRPKLIQVQLHIEQELVVYYM